MSDFSRKSNTKLLINPSAGRELLGSNLIISDVDVIVNHLISI